MLTEEMHLTGNKTILLLHGFDMVTLLFFIGHTLGFQQVAWAVYLGFIQHLLFDAVCNPARSPFSYFFVFRLINKFEVSEIYFAVDGKVWWKQRWAD